MPTSAASPARGPPWSRATQPCMCTLLSAALVGTLPPCSLPGHHPPGSSRSVTSTAALCTRREDGSTTPAADTTRHQRPLPSNRCSYLNNRDNNSPRLLYNSRYTNSYKSFSNSPCPLHSPTLRTPLCTLLTHHPLPNKPSLLSYIRLNPIPH